MIFLSLSTNYGNRLYNLRIAVQKLKESVFRSTAKESIILEVAPFFREDLTSDPSASYFNMVICGETDLAPDKLSFNIRKIEQSLDQTLNYKLQKSAAIEINILLFNNQFVNEHNIKIPHPDLLNQPHLLHLISLFGVDCYFTLPNNKYSNLSLAEISYKIVNFNSCFINSYVINPEIIGIINITPDSFSESEYRYDAEGVMSKTLKIHNDGASIVEFGAQSTRTGAKIISYLQEWERLEPVLEAFKVKYKNTINIAIDSIYPEIISKSLKYDNIKLVSDYNLKEFDKPLLNKILNNGSKIVLIHNLEIPPRRENVMKFNSDFISIVCNWFQMKINFLKKHGFILDNIIIDPGIGFSKSRYHSISILRNLHKLKDFGCPIMIGHSRKGMLQSFGNHAPNERDIETIAVSDFLIEKAQIDYLRVHNVRDHQRFFVVKYALN